MTSYADDVRIMRLAERVGELEAMLASCATLAELGDLRGIRRTHVPQELTSLLVHEVITDLRDRIARLTATGREMAEVLTEPDQCPKTTRRQLQRFTDTLDAHGWEPSA